jgi:acetyl-CoA C-acetyltransferase
MVTRPTVKGFSKPGEANGAVFEGVSIVAGKRTPFGKYTGALSTVSPTDLAVLASRATLAAAGVPGAEIDQTIFANIGQASADAFFAPRHVALYSGARVGTTALLVQRICGSGLEVIGEAATQIALARAQVVLSAGAETMSRFPLVSFTARQGFPLGKPQFSDMLWEALDDTAAVPMGATADNLAKKFQLRRDEVDAFAKQSQDRYAQAAAAGFFTDELVPVEAAELAATGLKPRKVKLNGVARLDADEHPRATTLDKLAKLPFIFSKEGPTTAGSASGIVDGAAAVLVASDEYAKAHGLKTLGKVRAVATVGVDPEIMGIGPVPAIKAALEASGLAVSDVDVFEVNEAFGAQCLAVAKALELDQAKLNPNGGAIAIGHPLAASGVRLALTCLRELRRRGGRIGVASACIGGGQGIALVLEAT